MLRRLAIVATLVAALTALALPAQADEKPKVEIRSQTVTVQPFIGYQCTSDPALIEVIGVTTEPPEAEDFLFVTEQPGAFCILSDYPEPVQVTVYYLALKKVPKETAA
jgi:hypothetical protein